MLAGNELLERYRPWLRLLARADIESRFNAKFDPSDVVQQTLIEACRAVGAFRGSTEVEWRAWLRRLLSHALAHEIRRYRGAQKRDLNRERSLEAALALSSHRLSQVLISPITSPSQGAVRGEDDLALAAALERLPADYREVICLRHFDELGFEEIARRMNRAPGAARMLWVRALARLRAEAARAQA
ncbi:MAG: sigma-70 family RNA polymerase sigma factor [Verrucomicrobia bacterium]|nr:sigma-70 family RNA polymerase sigma factor [Verrucomicrobiota bacterium]